MRGLGLLVTLVALLIGGYLTASSLKGTGGTADRVEQGRDTGDDAIAQSSLTQALSATGGLVVAGETTSFTNADLVAADPTFSRATGTETAGPSADPRAVSVTLSAGVLTLCNASRSGTAFCLRSGPSGESYSAAPGSVAAARSSTFGSGWPAAAPAPPTTAPADDVRDRLDGLGQTP